MFYLKPTGFSMQYQQHIQLHMCLKVKCRFHYTSILHASDAIHDSGRQNDEGEHTWRNIYARAWGTL